MNTKKPGLADLCGYRGVIVIEGTDNWLKFLTEFFPLEINAAVKSSFFKIGNMGVYYSDTVGIERQTVIRVGQ